MSSLVMAFAISLFGASTFAASSYEVGDWVKTPHFEGVIIGMTNDGRFKVRSDELSQRVNIYPERMIQKLPADTGKKFVAVDPEKCRLFWELDRKVVSGVLSQEANSYTFRLRFNDEKPFSRPYPLFFENRDKPFEIPSYECHGSSDGYQYYTYYGEVRDKEGHKVLTQQKRFCPDSEEWKRYHLEREGKSTEGLSQGVLVFTLTFVDESTMWLWRNGMRTECTLKSENYNGE